MIAEKEDSEPTAETPLPNSRKVYVAGKQHADLRVPFREISLAPTKTMSGEIEVNEPVRVYDTSGPWGDADHDARPSYKVCRRCARNGFATAAMSKKSKDAR